MRKIQFLPLWVSTLLLGACVTINIYFPAAAAEKAADRIIEEVWGTQPGEGKEKPKEDAPPPQSNRGDRNFGLAVLEWLVPAAHAAEPDLNIDTPSIRALRHSMQTRHGRLEPYYAGGAIGLDRQGLLTLRDPGAVALRDRNTLKQLIAQENGDRNRLYGEIAKANGHPEWEGRIRDTFADRWRHNARPGWWCQSKDGRWYKK